MVTYPFKIHFENYLEKVIAMLNLNILLSGLLFINTFIILILAIYSWKQRKINGALPLLLISIATSFYSFGYAMELLSDNVQSVDVWSRVQYIGLPFIPVLWIFLAKSYTHNFSKKDIPILILAGIPGLLTSALRMTSHYHHLMYVDMSMVSNGYFTVLQFGKGPWYYLHFVYFIGCAAYAIHLYLNKLQSVSGIYKHQIYIMIVASLMPFISIFVNLMGLFPLGLDSGPFFILFDFTLFALGIFRYSLLLLVPLSRDRVFEWIYDGVIVVDLNQNLIDFNQAAHNIFPSLTKNLVGMPPDPVKSIHPDFIQLIRNRQGNLLEGPFSTFENLEDSPYEFSMAQQDTGRESFYKVRFKDLKNDDITVGTAIMITDITNTKEMMRQLEKAAQEDVLTGLYNRRHFINCTNGVILKHDFVSDTGVLVLFDIDHFKIVNDTHGHQAGDLILKVISELTLKHLSPSDLAGRYGGEEFIIFLPNAKLPEAMATVESIRKAFETQKTPWDSALVNVTASFGLTALKCPSTDSNKTFDQMVREADEALYKAKELGRNCIEVYHG